VIIAFGSFSIWLQIEGAYEMAIILSNPVATLLAYKLVRGAKDRQVVKHPEEDPPTVLPGDHTP
jgi:hypothetical protein